MYKINLHLQTFWLTTSLAKSLPDIYCYVINFNFHNSYLCLGHSVRLHRINNDFINVLDVLYDCIE